MNPMLLSHWLLVCQQADIAAIGATIGPTVKIDEIYRFIEDLGGVPTLDRAYNWLRQNYQSRVNMWRWDCCSSEVLKSKPHLDRPPTIEFDLDEPRFLMALEELERRQETTVAVLVRSWVKAKFEAGYPVEFRAFVSPEGVAVSNYHRRRPLPNDYESIAIEVRILTERLATETPLTNFCADFLLTPEGKLLFLEGGLGFMRGGLVHPCCFDGDICPGALQLSVDSRQ